MNPMIEFFFKGIWLIPLYPLLAFAIIVLGLNRNKKASAWLAVIAIGLAWIHSWFIVAGTIASMADEHHGLFIEGWNQLLKWVSRFTFLFEANNVE